MIGSCGREGQRSIQGLATIYTGHQLGSDASECERLGFEAKAKKWARGFRHGVEQADGHVQQAEQFGLGVILSGQLTADVGAVSEQREALEVRSYVGSAILECRTVYEPPTIFGPWRPEGHFDAIADVQCAAKALGGAAS
jgi:hypothetical protein